MLSYMVARFVDTSCETMICSCSSYNCSIKTVPVKDSESATCSHSKRLSTIPDLNETSTVLTLEQGIVKTSFVVCFKVPEQLCSIFGCFDSQLALVCYIDYSALFKSYDFGYFCQVCLHMPKMHL